MIDALSGPIHVRGVDHVVTTSIGITYATLAATAGPGVVTVDKVLRQADAAMYRAKDRGKNRFEVHEQAPDATVLIECRARRVRALYGHTMRKTSRRSRSALVCAGFAVVLIGASACSAAGPDGGPAVASTMSTDASAPATVPGEQRFPDVVAVEIRLTGEDAYTLSVTVSSPYDAPEQYADGWRVLAPDGTTLGEHQLGHDHANEQPFTRTQTGLQIPGDVDEVTIEGRDQANGYGGGTITVEVPRGPA